MGPSGARNSTQSRSANHYQDVSVSSQTSDGTARQAHPGALENGLPFRSHHEEDSGWSHRIAHLLPKPANATAHRVAYWTKGPQPPRTWKIRPYFPRVQHAPLKLVNWLAPGSRRKLCLLLFLYFCWLLCFITILHHSTVSDEIPGYAAPSTLECTDTFWDKNNACGLDGNQCRPFENSTFAFRCPANCLPTKVLNPRAIGDQVVNYRPLVIGGPNDPSRSVETAVYRGDSFICSSAIHAGFITNENGGCGVVSIVGNSSSYPAVSQNDISSISFDSSFPLSFQFLPDTLTNCADLRWPLLAVTVIFTVLLSLSTTSPFVFFGSIFSSYFMHVALVSDPPSSSALPSLVSSALGRFLPAAFVGYVIYITAVRRTLTNLTAQIEKTVLYLGPLIVGCLNNYTFDKIPIQRLTPHDLRQQPGAITALVIIALVIFAIAVGQAWAIRLEGRMPRYLALYVTFGIVLGLLAAVPNMNLRIHHYILALLLLPGTALQNRPSLVYQGLLVGLFINGIARWGFDSILQTSDELREDALIGSPLVNVTATPQILENRNIAFTWPAPPFPEGFDGVSVLVGDVERWRGYVYESDSEESDGRGGAMAFSWSRTTATEDEPLYFRFGFLNGSTTGDYTKAGIWLANGSYVPMPEGAT